MSLHMANGDDGGLATWRVQDGNALSSNKGDHDAKVSDFGTTAFHEEEVLCDNSHQAVTSTSVKNDGSIVNQAITGEDRLFTNSSNEEENALTLSAEYNSFSNPDTIQPLSHSLFHPSSQLGSTSELQPQHPSINYPNTIISNIYDNDSHNTAAALRPSTNLFSPIGNRDINQWDARLSSGNTSDTVEVQSPGNTSIAQSQQQISLSSTPQQSNLSSKNDISYNISIIPALDPDSVARQPEPSLPISLTMGHNNNISDRTWSLDEDTKMDRVTPEGKNRDGDDSTVQSTAVLSTATHDDHDVEHDHLSPASSPRLLPASLPVHDSEETSHAIIGTPSTVSTEPSTEDAVSLGADSIDKAGLKLDPSHIEPFTLHRRGPSWDRSPLPNNMNLYSDTEFSASAQASTYQRQRQHADSQVYWQQSQSTGGPAQAYAHQLHQQQQQSHTTPASPWGSVHGGTQSRVASFRADNSAKHDTRTSGSYPYGRPPQHQAQVHGPQLATGDRWHQPPRPFSGDSQLPHYGGQQARGGHMQHSEGMGAHGYRHNPGYNPYSVQRKTGYPPQHPLPSGQSPGRGGRGATRPPGGPSPHRQQVPGVPGAAGSGGGGSRSSSEILKTLLRKKACLYEPDTSRAVALVTWLVGRELALEFGYFSRQQLQAGVHACVADKIESGTITRTKVNRCMQIILNSCFHYIIPRPDGTEEKGYTFRAAFHREVSDDAQLLRMLPAPWNDLVVNRAVVLRASLAELEGKPEPRSNQASPKGSPALKPLDHRSPVRDQAGDADNDSKRAVLLCFNENVRAAEDVFRCHNEFIRDSAHSSNLQLTAQEWRIFFGKEAASTPRIWGNVGIPVMAVESDNVIRKLDFLGLMTPEEAGKFRTTWCAKRYDHDHEFCGMAHVEVNGGWLRRNPNIYPYKDELCPSVTKMVDKRVSSNVFVINECPKGMNCECAHSHEELIYHPKRYKAKVCSSVTRSGSCRYGDICPNHHPMESARAAGIKKDGRSQSSRHGRSAQQPGQSGKSSSALPSGSPILYGSPAPVSSFERHLMMPGLQDLFRRQCHVVRATMRNPKCICCYSPLDLDSGIDVESSTSRSSARPGLPMPRV